MNDAVSDPLNDPQDDPRNAQEDEPVTDEPQQQGQDAPTTHALAQFPEQVAVVRLGPGAEVPGWAESSSVFAIIATAAETTVVCASRSVPRKAQQAGPYTAFEVAGPLDLGLVGVLATLLEPLAGAGVSVFTLSTFDTDWLLVPKAQAETAAEAWRRRGHTVAPAVPH